MHAHIRVRVRACVAVYIHTCVRVCLTVRVHGVCVSAHQIKVRWGAQVGAGVRRVQAQGWMEGGWLAVMFDWDGLLPVQVLQLVRRHVQPECV